MKTRLFLAVIFIVLLFEWGLAIPPDEIPFGIMIETPMANNISDTAIDLLRDSLGFNLCYPVDLAGNISKERYAHFKNMGLDVIPYMMDSTNTYERDAFRFYLNAHYIKIEAEDDISDIGFRTRNGHPGDAGWYVAPKDSFGQYTFLDNFWFGHEQKYLLGTINYKPYLYMRLYREAGIADSDTVAFLNVWISYPNWWICINDPESNDCQNVRHGGVYRTFPIRAGDFNSQNPTTLSFDRFPVPDTWIDTISTTPFRVDTVYIPIPPCRYDTIPGDFVFTYQIISAGICSLAVDWFKVSNQDGEDIMANRYDSTFAPYAHADTTALFWQLRDDMRTDQLQTAHHVDYIIDSVTTHRTSGMMKYAESFIVSPQYFKDVGQPKRFWIDHYPFWGGASGIGCTGNWNTLYYGDQLGANGQEKSLQYMMNWWVTGFLQRLRTTFGNSSELWYNAQLQTAQKSGCSTFINRRPTGSEMRMEAFLALSYGVKGVQYWPYGVDTGSISYCGLIDINGNKTEAWDRLKNYVTPYIQVLGKYYTPLTWDRSYNSHQIDSAGYYVTSIHGWSNADNPDTGWAQIGEFHDDSAKYIMLVNRACSLEDGTEAPDQHFTLKFNPSALGLGSHVYITDLADSLRHAGGDTGWVGIPRITYSTELGGTIPYTVTLKAGEGKLLKITPASSLNWLGNVNTVYTYQG
jgi:hypothetical protein